MTRAPVALALAAALALVGCARSGDDDAVVAPPLPPAPAPEPDPVDPGAGGGEVAPDDGQPLRVEVVPDAVDVHARDWSEVYVLDDGVTLELRWWGGVEPCYVVAGVEVEPGDDIVTVTLLEGRAPTEEDVACIDIARYTAVRVSLDEPIGDRSIIDGSE